MFYFWCRFFPVGMAGCALLLTWIEVQAPCAEGRPPRRRLLRMTGSALLLILAVLIWCGHLPTAATPPAQAWAMLRYWGLVFAGMAVLVCLALLDSLQGARALRTYLEAVEREEVARIRAHLERPEAG